VLISMKDQCFMEMKSNRIVTFGEIMLRLATPGFQRF